MGFEPFILPKREKQPEPTNREDRVAGLAKLLHERGLTSSMADAKRLAEGMVEGEKKVMKQAPKTVEQPKPAKLDIDAGQTPRPSASLRLPEEFSKFVAQAAAIPQGTAAQVSIPLPNAQPVRFGREAQHEIAAVPHATRKQVFYDEAPDLTKLRGYAGPKRQPVEFQSQKQDNGTALRVSTGDAGVKITKVEVTPKAETVTEEMIIVDEPEARAKPATQQDPVAATARQLLEEELKDAPEETVELPKDEKPREQRDLAKEHGVDLFAMFKKKD